MKRALAFLAVLTIFASAGTASADSFGAIAYSPTTGAAGWSHDYNNRSDAENVARGGCDNRADDCRVAIWFKNGCGAVAVGNNGGWGSGWGANRRLAEREAIGSCRANDGGCSVIRWQCSGAN